jgi:hypothetical protein
MTVTAVVTCKIAKPLSRAQVEETMRGAAPRFQGVPGLARKNFILNYEAGYGGGVYTWESREAGEKFYAGGWRERLIATFGAEPQIQWFDSPVIVDNEQGVVKA